MIFLVYLNADPRTGETHTQYFSVSPVHSFNIIHNSSRICFPITRIDISTCLNLKLAQNMLQLFPVKPKTTTKWKLLQHVR